MYAVANVDPAICAQSNCTICQMYCPEPNTIHYDKNRKSAYIAVDRCKGCEICVEICDHISKHHAIKMVAIEELEGGFELNRYGMPGPTRNGKATTAKAAAAAH